MPWCLSQSLTAVQILSDFSPICELLRGLSNHLITPDLVRIWVAFAAMARRLQHQVIVKRRSQIVIALVAALLSSSARAEAANGTLAVTASVQTSVALVTESDGSQRIVIANATDPRDNVSRIEPAKQHPVNGQPESKTSNQRRKK